MMASRHLSRISRIQRLAIPSSQSCLAGQAFFQCMQQCRSAMVLPTKTQAIMEVQSRALHLSSALRMSDYRQPKGQANATQTSGPQTIIPASQSKSFSVLNYLKKSIPLSMKLDVPIGYFSTGSAKDVGKNLGKVSSLKPSLFDFFSLRELLSTPAPFMVYGLGGLIPFSSIPVYMHMTSTYCPSLAHIQLVYGASILSFLGGVSWGFDLSKPNIASYKYLGYSILLPLISWVGVLIYPNVAAFPLFISSFAFAGYVDSQLMLYPLWFKNLRFVLTSLVILSLFYTFVLSFTKMEGKKKKIQSS